ncbi:MAG TPA: signal peptidase I [Anaerolineaceae bacterium]|nr:signal peptidase I [Anaerolineaceae bacterium]HPN51099.1 signal peptidase I [Anaerolineaceae bacterium]
METYQTEVLPEPAPPATNRKAILGILIDIVETLMLALVLFLGINALTARVRVENISMKPTLEPGQFVLVNRLAYKFGQAHRGDIIIFHNPANPDKEDYIKRVIGLPGDVVTVQNGTVQINGVIVKEDYIAAAPAYNGTWTVPPESFFVLGDNRNSSSDSHQWGMVSFNHVVGQAIFAYWPLDRFASLMIPDLVDQAKGSSQ